ncbi:hypothetical protein LIER_42593 [Lithospermum erythrorhizon]|uniref:Uncharacterized protein n=1 Tax=Lithospermum erythrorhizon TaxID=34254 RepID=A0AAV3NKU3_LITER
MSREQINALEDLVNKYKAYETYTICNDSQTSINHKQDLLQEELENPRDTYEESVHGINEELHSVKSEVVRLRSALEAVEIRFSEEQNRRAVEMRNAHELVEQIKSISIIRENELETKLKNSKTEMEIMKADLMDKQSDLEGIREENAFLNTRLSGVISGQAQYELEIELQNSISDIENLKANLMDKETQLRNLSKENEMLKLGMNKHNVNLDNVHDDISAEVEGALR